MSALIALGWLMLPWRFTAYSLTFLTLAFDFGVAAVLVSTFGWFLLVYRSIQDA